MAGGPLDAVPEWDNPPADCTIRYVIEGAALMPPGCDLLFTGDIDQVMLFDKVLPIKQIWDRFGFILNKPTLG